ncbi:hypothetical protein EK21DRAFT_46556, partial [Setomelanomma holmii]
EEKTTYHITAQMHSKFEVFPAQLRARVEFGYKKTIQSQMASLLSGTFPKLDHTYTVKTESSIRNSNPASVPNIAFVNDNIPSVSLTNTALLEEFLTTKTAALKKPSFVFLPQVKDLANPNFMRLHSVRHNEIGWGLDTNDCLSLHLVSIEDGRLHEYYIYVQ